MLWVPGADRVGVRESEGMETAGHLTQDTWGLSGDENPEGPSGDGGGKVGSAWGADQRQKERRSLPLKHKCGYCQAGAGLRAAPVCCSGPSCPSSLPCCFPLPGHTFFPRSQVSASAGQDLEASRAPSVGMGTGVTPERGVQR